MTPMQDHVLRFIEREQLIPFSGRVLVALSGGADSVALTLILHELASPSTFTLSGVVHLNHQLRESSTEDEQFCLAFAESLELPAAVERIDVAERSRRDAVSIEEAGHGERYAFFERLIRQGQADCVATGHTRNDQAETYLLRAIRGAGPTGLSGIQPRSGSIIRPLLETPRADLRAFLADRGQTFREDETNQDLRITRNRVRHRLIPFLAEHFSPSIVNVLAREAAIARGDAEWLEAAANKVAPAIVSTGESWASVNVKALSRLPTALARRVVKRAVEHVARRAVGFDHIERLRTLAGTSEHRAVAADFPGCRVERHEGEIRISRPAPRVTRAQATLGFEYRLPVPGEVDITEAGLKLSADWASNNTVPSSMSARGNTVAVAGGELSDTLTVRSWRPGDLVRPLGLGGRKKLQDLFSDRKVAKAERQTIPIVADTMKGIVWVVGHTVAEEFRVNSETQGVLILKVEKLGGFG